MLINEATRQFVRQHVDDDVRQLALQGTKDAEVDLTMALQQIAGRQAARRKLPSWAAVDDIVYPPHLNMEQCSSEQTARYKQQLVERLLGRNAESGAGSPVEMGRFVDLTGGFGVDFFWMSRGFGERVYVEQCAELCAIVEHNFGLLGQSCRVCCCDATTYLAEMAAADVIYLDPARRDEHGGRTYSIADCVPNVLTLLPVLLQKARCVIVKLSPMLDWRKAVGDLSHVAEVHIVSVDNECKELLVEMRNEKLEMRNVNEEMRNDAGGVRVVCVNFQKGGSQLFAFDANQQAQPISHFSSLISHSSSLISHFLYEPNASIMKAGCFAEVERRYAVRQLSANSHLFTGAVEIADFPGRRFLVYAISSASRHEVHAALEGQQRANIAVRNFPLTADQLRKKLKLKDGGDTYIFATTDANRQHLLLICRKIG